MATEDACSVLAAASEGAIFAVPLGAKARIPDGGSGPPGGGRVTQIAAERQGKGELVREKRVGMLPGSGEEAEQYS
jgi:hypothetical protein